jgi:tetratricopeptide (TPR) repeat protein
MSASQNLNCQARRALDEGFPTGALGKGPEAERHRRLLALAEQRAKEAPEALKAAAAKDGAALVRVGLALSAMGQHDKAIALIEQGIAKGG